MAVDAVAEWWGKSRIRGFINQLNRQREDFQMNEDWVFAEDVTTRM